MSKITFFTGQPIFSQLLNLIPSWIIGELTRKYNCNRYCKRFFIQDHLVSMLYAGFFQCTSLRELVTGLQANSSRLGHLGLKCTPRRSTLSDANQRACSLNFFQDLYHALYRLHFSLPDSRPADQKLFIIDSTTIGLFSSVMHGAGDYKANGKKKGGVKAHVAIDAEHYVPEFVRITEGKEQDLTFLKHVNIPDHATVVMDKGYAKFSQFNEWTIRKVRWITRQKNDASYRVLMQMPLDEDSLSYQNGVLKDELIRLGRPSNSKVTPLVLARRIEFYDTEQDRQFIFITNDFNSEPELIAGLYKRRWQIELLFKRIKQRYPLKYFLGDSPNAIQIQIWAALLCDLLVRIIQVQVNKTKKKLWAYASISSMIKHHLMTYIDLLQFLINPEKTLMHYKPPETTQLSLYGRGAWT